MSTKQLAALPGYTTCNINALSSNVQSGLPSVELTQHTLYVTIIAWQDHSGSMSLLEMSRSLQPFTLRTIEHLFYKEVSIIPLL